MIQLVRAFLWLRWRLLVNGLGGSRSRDRMGAIAAWAQLAVRLILGVLVVAGAIGVSLVTVVLTRGLAGDEQVEIALIGLRLMLGVLSLIAILFPILHPSGGEAAAPHRLRLLPVDERNLDRLDAASSLAEPWLAVLVPVPLVMAASLVVSGEVAAATVAVLVGSLMLVVVTVLSTVSRRLIAFVLRDRRRAEAASLLAIVVIMLASFATALVPGSGLDPSVPDSGSIHPGETDSGAVRSGSGEPRVGEAPGEITAVERQSTDFPLWLQIFPSELFVRSVYSALGSDWAVVLATFAGLLAIGTAAGLGARKLWRSMLGSPVSGSVRGGARRLRAPFRLVGISPAASSVAWSTVLTATRTVSGKLALVMPTLTVLVVGGSLAVVRAPAEQTFSITVLLGPQLAIGGVALAILGAQPFSLNQFAVDGEGLIRHLLSPIEARDIVVGKAVGIGLMIALAAALSIGVSTIVIGRGSLAAWLSVLLVVLPTYVLLTPVFAICSMLFPKAVDPGKLGSRSNPHQAATVIGLFAVVAALLPPSLTTFLALNLLGSPWIGVGLLAVLTVVSGLFAWPFLWQAGRALPGRLEAIQMALRQR